MRRMSKPILCDKEREIIKYLSASNSSRQGFFSDLPVAEKNNGTIVEIYGFHTYLGQLYICDNTSTENRFDLYTEESKDIISSYIVSGNYSDTPQSSNKKYNMEVAIVKKVGNNDTAESRFKGLIHVEENDGYEAYVYAFYTYTGHVYLLDTEGMDVPFSCYTEKSQKKIYDEIIKLRI